MHPSSFSWKITPLYFFLAQAIYTLLKRSTPKWTFLGISSARVKIRQISHVNFEMTSQFLFKYCIILHCHQNNLSMDFKPIPFLLLIKGSHQSPNFETFKYYGENLSYSSCHFPNHQLVFLQILYHPSVSWKITPLYFFRSNIKYFAQ